MDVLILSRWVAGGFAVLLVAFILWSLFGIVLFYWRRWRSEKKAKRKLSKKELIKSWEAKYRKVGKK